VSRGYANDGCNYVVAGHIHSIFMHKQHRRDSNHTIGWHIDRASEMAVALWSSRWRYASPGISRRRVSVCLTVCLCVCVCVSVTRRYCIKTAKRRITQTTPRDSPGNLVFRRQNSLSPCLKFALKLTHLPPFKHHKFDKYLLIEPQSWELANKSSIYTNKKSVDFLLVLIELLRFPTSHRWNVYVTPKSPKGGSKRDFAIFPVKFNYWRKSLLQSFFMCSYIIPLSNGPSPSTKYLRSEWPTPSENADFDRFRLIVPQPWVLARKVQLSPIGCWQCAFHQTIDEPCAIPLSPPKGGSKREFLHLALPFISSMHRHFKFGMRI